MSEETHTFRLLQDGIEVASVTASDRAAGLREIMHYATVYGQDGPCLIEGVTPADWAEFIHPHYSEGAN